MDEKNQLIKETEAKFPKIQFLGVTTLGLPIDKELIFQSEQGGKGVAFDIRPVKNNEWALTMIAGTVTFTDDNGAEQTKTFGLKTGEANFIVDRKTFQDYTPGQAIMFKVAKNETTGRENVRVLSLDAVEVPTSEPVKTEEKEEKKEKATA